MFSYNIIYTQDQKVGERMADVINIAQLRKVNSLANTLNKHGLAVNKLDAAERAREINGGKEGMDYLQGLKVNKEQEWEVVNTANGQQVIQESKKLPVSSDLMTREQVEVVLQKFCNLFSEEIYSLNAKIHGMELKFSYLQERLEGFEPVFQPELPAQEASIPKTSQQEIPVSEPNLAYQEEQTTLNSQKEPENSVYVEERPVQELDIVQQVAAHGSGRPPQQVEQPAADQQPRTEPIKHVEQPAPKPVDDGNPRTGGYDSEDVSIEKFFYFGSK